MRIDGLDGNWSTGMGQYRRTLFTKAWYDALSPSEQGTVINDASNPGNFNWHIYTRMNWGGTVGRGLPQGTDIVSLQKPTLFRTQPHAAHAGLVCLEQGNNGRGCRMASGPGGGLRCRVRLGHQPGQRGAIVGGPSSAEALQKYGATPGILEAVRQWETARMSGAFPESLKAQLRDNAKEFHLEPAGPDQWDLRPVLTAEPRALGPAIRIHARG